MKTEHLIQNFIKFDSWVHLPKEGEGNVVPFDEDSLRARFKATAVSAEYEGTKVVDVYHDLDTLLGIEECLTCSTNNEESSHLPFVVDALKAYKGHGDTSPLPHKGHFKDNGYYVRETSFGVD